MAILAFDALNFLSLFFDISGHSVRSISKKDFWRELRLAEVRVRNFVNAAKAALIDLIAVIDADTKVCAWVLKFECMHTELVHVYTPTGPTSTAAKTECANLLQCIQTNKQTAEAHRKWRTRRAREMRTMLKTVTLGADVFLGDMLCECGVKIVRPQGADADDVLASIAALPGALGVLSQDGDFFRYSPSVTVFSGWTVDREGKLVLTPASERSKGDRSARMIDPALAEHALEGGGVGEGSAPSVGDKYRSAEKTHRRIERGCSSSSDRMLGNLHIIARPLRAAVYARLGETDVPEVRGKVCDEFEFWAN